MMLSKMMLIPNKSEIFLIRSALYKEKERSTLIIQKKIPAKICILKKRRIIVESNSFCLISLMNHCDSPSDENDIINPYRVLAMMQLEKTVELYFRAITIKKRLKITFWKTLDKTPQNEFPISLSLNKDEILDNCCCLIDMMIFFRRYYKHTDYSNN